MSFLLFFQLKTSSTSLLTTKGCSFGNKPSTSSISQSFKCLEKRGLQLPNSPPSSQASNTYSSLLTANKNKLGKTSLNVWSSHHKSFQNLTFLPFPTIKRDLQRIPSHSFLMAFTPPHRSLPSLLSNTLPCFTKCLLFFFIYIYHV